MASASFLHRPARTSSPGLTRSRLLTASSNLLLLRSQRGASAVSVDQSRINNIVGHGLSCATIRTDNEEAENHDKGANELHAHRHKPSASWISSDFLEADQLLVYVPRAFGGLIECAVDASRGDLTDLVE